MAARGWARLILDRRRDLVNDRPSRAAAAEAPLDGAQERHHFDNLTHAVPFTMAKQQDAARIARLLCPILLLIS